MQTVTILFLHCLSFTPGFRLQLATWRLLGGRWKLLEPLELQVAESRLAMAEGCDQTRENCAQKMKFSPPAPLVYRQ